MVPSLRKVFNSQFTPEKYQAYLTDLNNLFPGAIEFRVAETPVFIDRTFKEKVLNACESIVDVITQFNFSSLTSHAIPPDVKVPNENKHAHFIAFDFGICENEHGEYEPQLIEMQGFPTLFGYQVWQDEVTRRHFDVPPGYSTYLNGHTRDSYLSLLREIL